MLTFAAFEAKTHFSKLLMEVEQGEEVIITKHGHAIAKVIPIKKQEYLTRIEAIARVKAFCKQHHLGDLNWKELRDEGRK